VPVFRNCLPLAILVFFFFFASVMQCSVCNTALPLWDRWQKVKFYILIILQTFIHSHLTLDLNTITVSGDEKIILKHIV